MAGHAVPSARPTGVHPRRRGLEHRAAVPLIPAVQAEVAAFLEREVGAPPLLTHISALFRGGEVLKLKLAVRLGFLDFTGLETRERLLRRELALNADAVPGLYRDVLPITRAGADGLVLGGAGPAVDWVLRMARVPDGDFLDERAKQGQLEAGLLTGLADAVADMHARQVPCGAADLPGTMRRVVEGNAAAARDAGLDAEAWARAVSGRLDVAAPLLQARSGLVRRAHGDLHLGNMLLWQGRPAPFDALEFDEALATIDPAYDLAFLLMDLEQRVSRAAANQVLNRYVARTGDAGLVGVLAPYLSLRAMIRAHVEAMRGRDAGHLMAAAAGYLQTASPVVLAVGGLMGAGKSTLARAVAPDLGPAPGALVVRSDEIRKRLYGVAPEDRLPDGAYDAAANRRTGEALATAVSAAVTGGHAVVADATFLDPAWAVAVQEAAGTAPFLGVWLDLPQDELERRVAARTGDASDADVIVLRSARDRARPPPGWKVVRSDGALREVRAGLAMLEPFP